MAKKGRMDFCVECRKDTEYSFQKRRIMQTIRDHEYEFEITAAICRDCGSEMDIPGLTDRNIKEIDEQYRAAEEIVTIEDIEKLMKIYHLGKAPLSLALGFGEVTISRYLAGQMPSREYSDIMRTALSSPDFMKKMLEENRDKIADSAYKKAAAAIEELKNLFTVSQKMLMVISYVFESLEEVTPLMLQKLLYFIQGVYYTLYGTPIFMEDCEAWVHGPVYRKVYDLFKDFKYNPIEDDRFVLLKGKSCELTEEERHAVDLVVNTFGIYGGKVLERITHKEEPWKAAREGLLQSASSREEVPKEAIRRYFEKMNRIYEIDTEEGLNQYIRDMLGTV